MNLEECIAQNVGSSRPFFGMSRVGGGGDEAGDSTNGVFLFSSNIHDDNFIFGIYLYKMETGHFAGEYAAVPMLL